MYLKIVIVCFAWCILLNSCSKKDDPRSSLEKEVIQRITDPKINTEGVWSDISYDITKTDSLTSPYTAMIKVKSDHGPIDGTSLSLIQHHEFHLVFQDGNWILKQYFIEGLLGAQEIPEGAGAWGKAIKLLGIK